MGQAIKESLLTANLAILFSVYIVYIFYIMTPSFTSLIGGVGTAVLYGALILAGIMGFVWRLYSSVLVAAVIGLGVLTVAIPLVYVMLTTIQGSLPTGSLEQGQELSQLVNSGASSLGLSSVLVMVVGAGLIILAIFLFMNFASGRYIESAE